LLSPGGRAKSQWSARLRGRITPVLWRANPMSITVTDPALLAQFATGDSVELKDPSGKLLGVFVPEGLGKLPPGVKSPFSEQELAELRKQRTGRPLADILRDLEARG